MSNKAAWITAIGTAAMAITGTIAILNTSPTKESSENNITIINSPSIDLRTPNTKKDPPSIDINIETAEPAKIKEMPEKAHNPNNSLPTLEGKNIIVGGFDVLRSGEYSFTDGQAFDKARLSLVENFSNILFMSSNTLGREFLNGIDILILTSAKANTSHSTPLITKEIESLYSFVREGGCAILMADNDSFGGNETPRANNNLISAFNMNIVGTKFGKEMVNVTTNINNPITSGSFGNIVSFSQNYPGGIRKTPSYASNLATNSLGTALVYIEKGIISPKSGPVTVYSDANTFSNSAGFFNENKNLFLYTVSSCL